MSDLETEQETCASFQLVSFFQNICLQKQGSIWCNTWEGHTNVHTYMVKKFHIHDEPHSILLALIKKQQSNI